MQPRYVLLTAAKDEQASIGDIIQAVLCQTVRPVAWFIMDDGSTDRTAAIVNEFAAMHPFIHLQSAGARGGRNFGSQYKAVMAAFELAKPLEFDFVGVVDADQAPESANYYESMLGEFARNPRLGIGSGFLYERYNGSSVWECRRSNSLDSVAGGSALFRRQCFEQVGGYQPLVLGGSDWLIQIEARLRGWEIFTRPDLHIFHYRPTSSAGGIWRGMFKAGKMDAAFGSNTLFEFLKCCRRITTNPYFFGSVVRFSGFLSWKLSFRKPLIRPEAVAYLRRDQAAKLRRWLLPFAETPAAQLSSSAPRA
jgi:biofilm PGA synthesis N-glycosyltransferase PgaC